MKCLINTEDMEHFKHICTEVASEVGFDPEHLILRFEANYIDGEYEYLFKVGIEDELLKFIQLETGHTMRELTHNFLETAGLIHP